MKNAGYNGEATRQQLLVTLGQKQATKPVENDG